LRELEDVAARERAMHELDNGKDQLMTVMKVALANLYVIRNRLICCTTPCRDHAARCCIEKMGEPAASVAA